MSIIEQIKAYVERLKATNPSEKPCEGLEEEIRDYMSNEDNNPFDLDWRDKRDCARHFAQWGAEHLADARKTLPKDLEEAAEEYAHCPFTDDDGNFHEDAIDETAYNDFIAGAKWHREQIMKEVVEARVIGIGLCDTPHIVLGLSDEFKKGDKVRIIIVKEDSNEGK